jgi:hypothetical protein
VSLIDDFGYSDETPRARWLNRLAHLFPWAALGLLAVRVPVWTGLIPRASLIYFLLFIPVGALLLIGHGHVILSRICLRCMQAVPEDAGIRAATRRKRFWLRLNHLSIWQLAVIIGVALAVEVTIRRILGPEPAPGWIAMPLDIFLAATFWATWQHHRYRPWCPWCRDWGSGGHPEHVPDPVNPATKVA